VLPWGALLFALGSPVVSAADPVTQVADCPTDFARQVSEAMLLRNGISAEAGADPSGDASGTAVSGFDLRFDLALVINDFITKRNELVDAMRVPDRVRELSIPELRALRDDGSVVSAACQIVALMQTYYRDSRSGRLARRERVLAADPVSTSESSREAGISLDSEGSAPETESVSAPESVASSESVSKGEGDSDSDSDSEPIEADSESIEAGAGAGDVREAEAPSQVAAAIQTPTSDEVRAPSRKPEPRLVQDRTAPLGNVPTRVTPRAEPKATENAAARTVARTATAPAASPKGGSKRRAAVKQDVAVGTKVRSFDAVAPLGREAQPPVVAPDPELERREQAARRTLSRIDELLDVPVYLTLAELRRQNLTLPDSELGKRRRNAIAARAELLQVLAELDKDPLTRRIIERELGPQGVDRFTRRLEATFGGRRVSDDRAQALALWRGSRSP